MIFQDDTHVADLNSAQYKYYELSAEITLYQKLISQIYNPDVLRVGVQLGYTKQTDWFGNIDSIQKLLEISTPSGVSNPMSMAEMLNGFAAALQADEALSSRAQALSSLWASISEKTKAYNAQQRLWGTMQNSSIPQILYNKISGVDAEAGLVKVGA